ncbi:hypothetical protein M407DRAFT_12128 [Tulasnella calospora MUT 4182]|uniref:Uncharacterized protein n=1 Tax=Tulasnella calospora MUT 4182 TaxID=1051891 RepID=A0A0C3L8Z4_9AGAM|nr:hypothetical protein M407DRAFT_12128 [Tulasnella calospora MUT 4182]
MFLTLRVHATYSQIQPQTSSSVMAEHLSLSGYISPCLSTVSFSTVGSDDEGSSWICGAPCDGGCLAGDITARPRSEGNEENLDQEPLLLCYRGYLEIDIKVYHCNHANLHKGNEICDRMIDFLIHQSHTSAYEAFRWRRPNEVLIFPCAFAQCLLAVDEAVSQVELAHKLQCLHSKVVRFTPAQIWTSTLLIVPAQVGCHRVLLAVTNARLAMSQSEPARSIHEVIPGHSRPDRTPFAILFLSSTPLVISTDIERIKVLFQLYLQVLWKRQSGSDLEFIDWVDVNSPGQDIVSKEALHVVRNAEVLMRPGVADRLRQAHQGVYMMKAAEWNAIFNPQVMEGDFYRQRKLKVVKQEAQLWQMNA